MTTKLGNFGRVHLVVPSEGKVLVESVAHVAADNVESVLARRIKLASLDAVLRLLEALGVDAVRKPTLLPNVYRDCSIEEIKAWLAESRISEKVVWLAARNVDAETIRQRLDSYHSGTKQ